MTPHTGCQTCDRHGPEEDTMLGAFTEMHRAMHDLGRSLLTVQFVAYVFTVWVVAAAAAVVHAWLP